MKQMMADPYYPYNMYPPNAFSPPPPAYFPLANVNTYEPPPPDNSSSGQYPYHTPPMFSNNNQVHPVDPNGGNQVPIKPMNRIAVVGLIAVVGGVIFVISLVVSLLL